MAASQMRCWISDQLVTELNQLGAYRSRNRTATPIPSPFANGLTLVQGSNTCQVEAVPSSSDPSCLTIGYNRGQLCQRSAGRPDHQRHAERRAEIPQRNALDGVRNRWASWRWRWRTALTNSIAPGFDLNGDAGGDFFSFSGRPGGG